MLDSDEKANALTKSSTDFKFLLNVDLYFSSIKTH